MAGFLEVHPVRWSAPLVALCLAVAACSDGEPSAVPAEPTGTAALPSVPRDAESSGNEVRVAVPPPPAAPTTEPAQSLSHIERPGTAPRLGRYVNYTHMMPTRYQIPAEARPR